MERPSHLFKGNSSYGHVAGFPLKIWQHIFTYLTPQTLGHLLKVNRAFNHSLTLLDGPIQGRDTSSILRPLSSEEIWQSSRGLYFPLLPKPLPGCSELTMWKLLLGTKCQFCYQAQSDRGFGYNGNRIVWPFAVRCCAKCLEDRTRNVGVLINLD